MHFARYIQVQHLHVTTSDQWKHMMCRTIKLRDGWLSQDTASILLLSLIWKVVSWYLNNITFYAFVIDYLKFLDIHIDSAGDVIKAGTDWPRAIGRSRNELRRMFEYAGSTLKVTLLISASVTKFTWGGFQGDNSHNMCLKRQCNLSLWVDTLLFKAPLNNLR